MSDVVQQIKFFKHIYIYLKYIYDVNVLEVS